MVKPPTTAAILHAQRGQDASLIYRRVTPIEPAMTGRFADFVAGAFLRNLVIAIIIFSAILMGVETMAWAKTGLASRIVQRLDTAVTVAFVLELVAKLVVFRWRFFRDGWNVFDLLIVIISLMPATQGLRVIRTLRVLRVLRLLSAVPSMRQVISGLLRAIPGMLSATALLLIVIYVFAILSTQLFGSQCYQGYLDDCTYFFGTLYDSLFTLFQIMTLESWSHGIVRPIADAYPWARGFFVLYVVITAFAALNLFIGVVVNAMDGAHKDEAEADQPTLADLQAQIGELKALIQTQK